MTDYEWTPLYYDGLVQVRYYDADDDVVKGGFCYSNRLVDAASGMEMLIEDVVEQAALHGWDREDAVVELDWRDLNKAVL